MLLMHGIHSLSRSFEFSAFFSWQAIIIGIKLKAVELLAVGILLLESESKASELFESMGILARSSLLLEVLRLILFIGLDTLTT